MAVLIDSSVFISLERSGEPLEGFIESLGDEESYLASMTAAELLIGVHRADSEERRMRRQNFVEQTLSLVTVVPFDLQVARTHAALWDRMAAAGGLIGDRDLMIAATALTYGYDVLTLDLRDFGRVPDLTVRRANL